MLAPPSGIARARHLHLSRARLAAPGTPAPLPRVEGLGIWSFSATASGASGPPLAQPAADSTRLGPPPWTTAFGPPPWTTAFEPAGFGGYSPYGYSYGYGRGGTGWGGYGRDSAWDVAYGGGDSLGRYPTRTRT